MKVSVMKAGLVNVDSVIQLEPLTMVLCVLTVLSVFMCFNQNKEHSLHKNTVLLPPPGG